MSFETGNICSFQKDQNFNKRNNKSLSMGHHILFRKRSTHCHCYRRGWDVWAITEDPPYSNAFRKGVKQLAGVIRYFRL
jgi:hypothetical protein